MHVSFHFLVLFSFCRFFIFELEKRRCLARLSPRRGDGGRRRLSGHRVCHVRRGDDRARPLGPRRKTGDWRGEWINVLNNEQCIRFWALQDIFAKFGINSANINDHFSHLRLLVESIESDSLKANKGNKAAGVRLRKSLRYIKGFTGDFVKFTLNKD